MAIITQVGKKVNINSFSVVADGDLSSYQYCAVMYSGASTGTVKVKAPTGQGVMCAGILQTYDCDDAETAEIMDSGFSSAIAAEAFNSGVELTPLDTTGKLEEAASGDYIIAIAHQAATAANEVVSVRVIVPYQKN